MGYGFTGYGTRRYLWYEKGRIRKCGQRFCVRDDSSEIPKGAIGGPLVISYKIKKGKKSYCQLAINANNNGDQMFFAQIDALQLSSKFSDIGRLECKEGRKRKPKDDDDDDR